MKKFVVIFLLLFCILIFSCDNENSNISQNAGANNQDNNNQGNDNQNGGNKGNEIPENGNNEEIVLKNPMDLIKGTIWYADRGSIFIQFSNTNISFRNNQNYGNMGGNLNGIVTHGSFRISSYDGETMIVLDYDNKEVSFSVVITDNKMVVERLGSIRWTAPPYQPRFFGQWNGTYTKGE